MRATILFVLVLLVSGCSPTNTPNFLKVSAMEDKSAEQGAQFLYEEVDVVYYRKVPREEIQIVQTLDAGEVIRLSEAEYKETPEELLYKEGYYEYRRVPAIFETVTMKMVESINNVCEDTERIEVEQNFLVKGAYTDVEIIPAEYGLVTLDVVLGEDDDKLELRDDIVGELSVEQMVLPTSLNVLEDIEDIQILTCLAISRLIPTNLKIH